MNAKIKIGTVGTKNFNVEKAHTIGFANEQLPAVLSTPVLIQFLEMAAREAVAPFLAEGQVTLGTGVDLAHLAPTPLGENVTCLARLVRTDGPNLSFQVEARDRHELIAKGFHTRAVIAVDRFARRVARKAGGGH